MDHPESADYAANPGRARTPAGEAPANRAAEKLRAFAAANPAHDDARWALATLAAVPASSGPAVEGLLEGLADGGGQAIVSRPRKRRWTPRSHTCWQVWLKKHAVLACSSQPIGTTQPFWRVLSITA